MGLSGLRGVAFEGGGVRGLAYLPIIEYLEQHGLLEEVTHFAGASAGAITAMMLACGASSRTIAYAADRTDWGSFTPGFSRSARLFRLLFKYGLYETKGARRFIQEQMAIAGWSPRLTFGKLYKYSNKTLVVTAVNEVSGKTVAFSPDTTPDVTICDAVLASMAIPIFYVPVEIDGAPYSDGGLTHNYPLNILADNYSIPLGRLLGVRVDTQFEIDGRVNGEVRSLHGRILRLVSIASEAANKAYMDEGVWKRTVRINTGSIASTAFDLSDEDALYLFEVGRAALERFLEKCGKE